MKYLLIAMLLTTTTTAAAESVDSIYASVEAIAHKDGHEVLPAFQDAVLVNIRPDCRELLVPILVAVRYAENGRPGREYGVLHPKALGKSYRTQAGWSAATIQKQFDRYVASGGDPKDVAAYLISLRNRYCPIGADNDPLGLNSHWLKNVSSFRARILSGTLIRKEFS